MTRKRQIIYGIGGLIAAAAAVLAALSLRLPPAQPDLAPYLARAADYDVEIRRDDFGVPHIYGQRDADVAFGVAYAHAEDDFATIEEVVIATRGTLAARKGPDAAVTDYLVRLFDVWGTVKRNYASLPAETRAIAEAYADGFNLYVAQRAPERAAGLLPVTGEDVVAGFIFKTPFFYGLDSVLLKLNEPDKEQHLSKEAESAFLLREGPDVEIGSNAVAVGPSRSADGKTRLLVNSHQPYTGPVAWYEVRLKSEEGLDMAGGIFPGTPVVLHGHNRRLGWANTVNKPDLADVYALEVNPDNEMEYRFDGGWKRFEAETAEIDVRLWGPFHWTVRRDVLRSAHGPVLKTDQGTFAIRYAGMGEYRQLDQYYRLNKAQTFEEWREAMRMLALPSINYVYADADGNIGYFYNMQSPLRPELPGLPEAPGGTDWQGVLRGDDPALIWDGYHPFDAVPQVINPPSGFVVNANNTPFQSTSAADAPKPADFPRAMGIGTQETNRGLRALELYGNDPAITAAEFEAYKYDLGYSARSDIAELIAKLAVADFSGDPALEAAQAVLRRWDLRTNKENMAAALGVLTVEPVLTAQREGTPAPEPQEALRAAADLLMENFGALEVPWGEVNRLRRGAVDLPLDGGPDILRAVYGRKLNGDGTLTAQAGDTFIMVVEWDEDGALTSRSIHQFGSATLDESSPHFADQAPLFAERQLKPVYLDESALEPHITRRYRPGDEEAAP